MSIQLTLCAPCLFGLESVLSYEVKKIGGQNVVVSDGKVTFTGDFSLLARANISLRCAERVCLVLGSFYATSFTELFDQVEQLPFEDFIGKKDAFPVTGWSLNSQLHSVPDCQSIIKRAVVRRFERVYNQTWFEESGPVHQIRFTIHKDLVTIMLDTSGIGLHKRGYRKGTGNAAPLKETLAAGIADLARVKSDTMVVDPMCGSGTLLIESALKAYNIPPGVRRSFAAEQWGAVPSAVWKEQREAALAQINRESTFKGLGFDIDPEAVALTRENAVKAGVGRKIEAVEQDIGRFSLPPTDQKIVVLCNPPYGERLLEVKQAEELYRKMGKVFASRPDCSYYVITPHQDFEKLFGRKADKRRKLYNGMIKCQLYMYFGG